MRYVGINRFQFTRIASNETADVTGIRNVSIEFSGRYMNRSGNKQFDEISVDFYGSGMERLWYRIADANMDIVLQERFDMSRINTLRIP